VKTYVLLALHFTLRSFNDLMEIAPRPLGQRGTA